MNRTKKKRIFMIAESAIMLALATALSLIAFAPWPAGGSVTVFSMLPILIIAYRYGMKWGFLVGSVYGLIQMMLGMSALSYATNAWAAICIILFDYAVAFGVLGFGGLFRKLNNQAIGFSLGVIVACVLRFLCHFLTGITVWADYADGIWPVVIYSLTYNGSYMLPELVITTVVGALLMSFLDFKDEKLKPLRKTK
ncbi:MAG: energy-coupled thiamine transporter ThiT [Ruminococcaceae bacterium]|nr:energy-coupled thiamine transporter ThiT [Oscillospiraceae bacterium]